MVRPEDGEETAQVSAAAGPARGSLRLLSPPSPGSGCLPGRRPAPRYPPPLPRDPGQVPPPRPVPSLPPRALPLSCAGAALGLLLPPRPRVSLPTSLSPSLPPPSDSSLARHPHRYLSVCSLAYEHQLSGIYRLSLSGCSRFCAFAQTIFVVAYLGNSLAFLFCGH